MNPSRKTIRPDRRLAVRLGVPRDPEVNPSIQAPLLSTVVGKVVRGGCIWVPALEACKYESRFGGRRALGCARGRALRVRLSQFGGRPQSRLRSTPDRPRARRFTGINTPLRGPRVLRISRPALVRGDRCSRSASWLSLPICRPEPCRVLSTGRRRVARRLAGGRTLTPRLAGPSLSVSALRGKLRTPAVGPPASPDHCPVALTRECGSRTSRSALAGQRPVAPTITYSSQFNTQWKEPTHHED